MQLDPELPESFKVSSKSQEIHIHHHHHYEVDHPKEEEKKEEEAPKKHKKKKKAKKVEEHKPTKTIFMPSTAANSYSKAPI